MTVIEFRFDLKQEVSIKSLNTKGFIVGYYYGEMGTQYQVSYFNNGAHCLTYLFEEELEPIKGIERSNVGTV